MLDIVCKPGSPVRHAIHILAHVRRACWQVMTYMPAVRARVRMTECCSLQVMKTVVTASTSRRQCYATTSRQMPPRGSIDAPARQWRPWDPWRPSLLCNTGQKRPNQHTQLQLNKEECSLCLSFLSSPQCYLPRRLQAPLLCFPASHWSHLTAQAPQLPYPATILRLHVPNRMTEC